MDLNIKNRTLLNKWVWRYADEPNAMWRTIIASKYGGDHSGLFPLTVHHRRFSGLWKNITKPICSHDSQSNAFLSSFGYSFGDGGCIRFWWDSWIDGVVLKSAFPRIFALSTNKEGKVREFGSWCNNVWHWTILLRRRLFGWELHQWSELLSFLKGFVVCDKVKDSLIWKGSTSGRYSANLYAKSVLCSSPSYEEFWKLVWVGLAPPKVEVFCWQLMQGRIATKDQLARRGVMDWNLAVCTFCNAERESVSHLFFSCFISWKIWMYVCSLWELNWVMHKEPMVALLAWQHALPNKCCKVVWKMVFFAIIWSIWLLRNDLVFNGKAFNFQQTIDIVKF